MLHYNIRTFLYIFLLAKVKHFKITKTMHFMISYVFIMRNLNMQRFAFIGNLVRLQTGTLLNCKNETARILHFDGTVPNIEYPLRYLIERKKKKKNEKTIPLELLFSSFIKRKILIFHFYDLKVFSSEGLLVPNKKKKKKKEKKNKSKKNSFVLTAILFSISHILKYISCHCRRYNVEHVTVNALYYATLA